MKYEQKRNSGYNKIGDNRRKSGKGCGKIHSIFFHFSSTTEEVKIEKKPSIKITKDKIPKQKQK